MTFNTNILKSNTAKQVFGALAGMAIAGLLYIGVDQASYLNIKGLLVSTETISENAGQVRVNATNVDEATERQLAARGAAVREQLRSSASALSSSQIAENPLSKTVTARREQRIFANQLSAAFASAPTYANDPNRVMSVEERVAIRAARIADLPAPAFAPQPLGVGDEDQPSLTRTVSTQAAPVGAPATREPVLHPAASIDQHSGALPNSGLGLNLLVLLSLGCAFFSVKTQLRNRVVALIS